ncbi:MAG: hypothetical protein AB1642_06820 [Pseudomonadota bacterium]
MINLFRSWCEKNAPIFDFVSKMLLGFAGLFFAVQAFQIASTQLDIQKGQLDIQKRQVDIQNTQIDIQRSQATAQMAQHIPNLKVQLSLNKGSKTKERIDDLVIVNDGGDIFSQHFDVFVFWMPRELPIERMDSNGRLVTTSDLRAALIPVEGYFSAVSYTSPMSKGELFRLKGRSLRKWDTIVGQFVKQHSSNSKSLVGIMRIFVRAQYSDKFAKNYEQFIEVSSTGQRQLSEQYGKELMHAHKFGIPGVNPVYINMATYEVLADTWEHYASYETWKRYYSP